MKLFVERGLFLRRWFKKLFDKNKKNWFTRKHVQYITKHHP